MSRIVFVDSGAVTVTARMEEACLDAALRLHRLMVRQVDFIAREGDGRVYAEGELTTSYTDGFFVELSGMEFFLSLRTPRVVRACFLVPRDVLARRWT